MHTDYRPKITNLNNIIMIKKLLLGFVAAAITGSAAMAELQINQSLTQELIKANFTASQATYNQGSKVVRYAKASDNTQILLEDFETFNTETLMPEGWIAIDKLVDKGVFCTNILESTQGGLQAFSGDIGLASMYNDEAARDAWAIAPGVELEAGKTYHFGIYTYCQGYNGVIDEWQLTIGNAQTAESQTTVIIDKTGNNATTDKEWTLCTGTFTPAESGTYYAAIHHCSQTNGGNICLWDYFQIDSDHVKILPRGSMTSVRGLWSMDGHTQDEDGSIGMYRLYIQEGDYIKYACYATDCTSVEWDFGPYATTPDYTASQPESTYDFSSASSDEVYNDVFLTMRNDDGEAYAMREFFVNRLNNKTTYTDFVGNFCPEDGFYIYLGGSSQYDALSGLNPSYVRFAERFTLPKNVSTTVSGAYLIPIYYSMSIINRKKEFTVRVLQADENNMPGEAVYSENFKFEDIFGTTGFQGSAIAPLVFEGDPMVKGTFFIEFEFPEGITIGSQNHLFFASSSARPFSEGCTSFYYNEVGTASKPEGWLSAVDYYGAGVSTAIYPLVTFQNNTAVIAPQMSHCTVFANGSEISVMNAPQGSDIVVTDIAGRIVLNQKANGLRTTINSNLNAGIYIVTVNGVSTKITIR